MSPSPTDVGSRRGPRGQDWKNSQAARPAQSVDRPERDVGSSQKPKAPASDPMSRLWLGDGVGGGRGTSPCPGASPKLRRISVWIGWNLTGMTIKLSHRPQHLECPRGRAGLASMAASSLPGPPTLPSHSSDGAAGVGDHRGGDLEPPRGRGRGGLSTRGSAWQGPAPTAAEGFGGARADPAGCEVHLSWVARVAPRLARGAGNRVPSIAC